LFLDNREYDRAIEQALKGIELNPSFDLAWVWLAEAYRLAGKFSEALAALDRVRAVPTGAFRAQVLADAGDRVVAEQLLADLEKRPITDRAGRLAGAHLALGDKDQTFLWLERGIEGRDQMVLNLKVGPEWDAIRSEPRYHALLKRMNLE
jgi:tetratricopeptide (TPR) repeat protein